MLSEVRLVARRFLADNVLEQLGAAAKASADMVANCAEAYLEELKLLGRPYHLATKIWIPVAYNAL